MGLISILRRIHTRTHVRATDQYAAQSAAGMGSRQRRSSVEGRSIARRIRVPLTRRKSCSDSMVSTGDAENRLCSSFMRGRFLDSDTIKEPYLWGVHAVERGMVPARGSNGALRKQSPNLQLQVVDQCGRGPEFECLEPELEYQVWMRSACPKRRTWKLSERRCPDVKLIDRTTAFAQSVRPSFPFLLESWFIPSVYEP
ncbi:hypothetical protein EI94DRAFT_1717963 [Lactarius quietus]|nr:hypothetical protein EI94DRAFT_1717963 [Lactarius quietus]